MQKQPVYHVHNNHNKKFELMLTRRAKAYSSSGSVVTYCSTNRARCKVTSFQPKRVTNYATPPAPVPWRQLVNDIDLRSPKSRKKSTKPPILAFKVIQGHWIRRQSTASIRFYIID